MMTFYVKCITIYLLLKSLCMCNIQILCRVYFVLVGFGEFCTCKFSTWSQLSNTEIKNIHFVEALLSFFSKPRTYT